jgi:pimeloyl-ACP methyl ester carboxylesterase
VKLRTVAMVAGGVAAALAAERLVAGRIRSGIDEEALDAFRTPEDAVHHHVPTSDGGSLHVVERGPDHARPLILLHGITLTSLTWHYQLRDLADRYRVLAVDHRGHGASQAGHGGWELDRLALDVRELVDHLDQRDAVVVGHSMGGMVTLQFALDHPETRRERVAGLVLLSTSASPVHRLGAWKALTSATTPSLRRGLQLGDRLPGGMFAERDLSTLLFRLGMGAGAAPEHVELNRRMTASTPVSVWSELLAGVVGFDVRDRLHEIDTPAVVFVGTRDLLTPPSLAKRIVGGLPNARPLEVFPGAGHMLMLERHEDVADRIDRFVKELA